MTTEVQTTSSWPEKRRMARRCRKHGATPILRQAQLPGQQSTRLSSGAPSEYLPSLGLSHDWLGECRQPLETGPSWRWMYIERFCTSHSSSGINHAVNALHRCYTLVGLFTPHRRRPHTRPSQEYGPVPCQGTGAGSGELKVRLHSYRLT